MAAFNSFGHLALKVRDLEASVGFYEKLGFPEFLRLTEEDGRPWIVYMRFDDNLYLELFPGGTERVNQTATGTNHMCLTVDDIEATARGGIDFNRVPEPLARHLSIVSSQVRVVDLPFESPRIDLKQFWHRKFHHDPRNRWLRALTCKLFQTPRA